MKAPGYATAVTRRATGQAEPLRHALRHTMPRYSRTGRTYRAECGAQVATVIDETGWDPAHARACADCREVLR